jgi:sec-independent protein translocase protein TatA
MSLFEPGHLIPLLILAAILFFGWKQLPDMARSLGRSLRIFKTEIKGMSEDDKARDAAKAEPPAIEAPAAEAAVVEKPVPAEQVKARPRPAPNPNGRAQSSAKAE